MITSEAREMAQAIVDAMDHGGVLQATDMLEIAPARPECHTAMTWRQAADALGCRAEIDALLDEMS